ncbi:MAG: hypothetical protein PHY80_02160 [Rickettsiales bacterium]|nr:hypothetical protein [Rickettsiales bacterium]
MKKIFYLFIFLTISVNASSETYKVYVKRIDNNLYKTSSGTIIKTKYCYEYSYGEDAILEYEQYSYSNKLIFLNSETVCDVDKIL